MEQLVLAMGATLAYAITGLFKATAKGEKVDLVKFGATVVYGLAVGGAMYFLGVPVNENTILVSLTSYAGALAVFENLIKGTKEYLSPKVVKV